MLYLILMLSSHSCSLRTLLDHSLAALARSFDRFHVIEHARAHSLDIYSGCSPLLDRSHPFIHPYISIHSDHPPIYSLIHPLIIHLLCWLLLLHPTSHRCLRWNTKWWRWGRGIQLFECLFLGWIYSGPGLYSSRHRFVEFISATRLAYSSATRAR